MAQVKIQKPSNPTKIDRFLGLNEDSTGDTQLKLGESPDMTNFRITENYKLKKREGYSQLFSSYGSYNIRGIFNGIINSTEYFLFAMNSNIWVRQIFSGTSYNTLDNTTYANVDVVKTTALTLAPIQAGTTGIDGFNIYTDSSSTTLSEIAQASINTADASSTSSTIATTVLTVAGSLTGTFAIGQYIVGTGITTGTKIVSLGTGTGGAGTYNINFSQTVAVPVSINAIKIKYYYHTDKTIWIILPPDLYVDIASARTGLGTTNIYQKLYSATVSLTDVITNFFTYQDTTYTLGTTVSSTNAISLYIMDGTDYYYWDGTTYDKVTGYIPQVSISSLYDGTEASEFESLNNLTNKRYQSLTGASEYSISATQYDSQDTTTYAAVDVIKTTPVNSIVAGTTGIDAIMVVKNSAGTTLTEVTAANINTSAGKYYVHTDKSIWFIVTAGTYADIAAARLGLATSTWTPLVYKLAESHLKSVDNVYLFSSTTNLYTLKTVTTDYVANTELGTIRFISQPVANPNTIRVYYTKGWETIISSVSGTLTYNIKFDNTNITNLDSVDFVYLNGTLKVLTTDYTVSTTNGTITFVSNPGTGTSNISIFASKVSISRKEVTDRKYSMQFGGNTDFRIFLYGKITGNGTNRYYYSNIANGLPSASYFPALFYNDVGNTGTIITGITKQYDRQIIYTDISGAYFSFYETTLIDGITYPSFPLKTLNKAIGNVALGQIQVIENNPVSIFKGIYEWYGTQVQDERNAKYISKRVQVSLDAIDLSQVLTIDWEKNYEYITCSGQDAFIYNYRLDVWYKFLFDDVISCLYIIDDSLYIGTNDGKISYFSSSVYDDDGNSINSHWESGFYDFDAEYLQKYIYQMWISLKPEGKSSVDITYQTNYNESSQTYTATYDLATFTAMDFADFSFAVSGNPQPFRFKIKAKKFVYFKIMLDNDNMAETLTVLSINLASTYGSQTR